MINYISTAVIPLMLFGIIAHGLANRVQIFDSFVLGAKDGLESCIRIIPSLVALLTAVSMFKASGALEIIVRLLSPVLSLLRFPEEVMPLALMRPISGSGSLAVVESILKAHGPDSFAGRATSVMMGSTETTFYTLAVYFGAVGVKDTRFTVKAALFADLVSVIASIWIVRIIFS